MLPLFYPYLFYLYLSICKSVLVELGDQLHSNRLIQGCHDGQAILVGAPIEADNGLRRNNSGIEQLDIAHDADGRSIVGMLAGAAKGVVILVDIEPSVATARGKDVTVLRQMLGKPNGTAVSLFGEMAEAFQRMVRTHVIDMEFALEGRDDELIHFNVGTIKLDGGDAIAAIGFPSDLTPHLEVEQPNISIVISSTDATLLIVVGISKGNRPAISRGGFFRWGQGGNSVAYPRVKDSNETILTGSDEFGCSVLSISFAAATTNAVNGIDDLPTTGLG